MTGSRSNQVKGSTSSADAERLAPAAGNSSGKSKPAGRNPGDALTTIAAAVAAIPLLALRELIGAAQDYHERIPSRRAAWLVRGIEICGGLLLLLAGWILLQAALHIGSNPVPTEPLPALRADSDAIRSSMFYMLAIGLLAPVTLFLTWAAWKFLFNLVDSLLHRYVPRVFRPFAAPILAVLLACTFWINRDNLVDNFWESYRSLQHHYAQATLSINARR